jgi:PAS domain S-box-containing protein
VEMKSPTYIKLPRWSHYVIAVILSGLVIALRLAITPLVGDGDPFLIASMAVMISAFIGGLWPGLLGTFLTTAFGVWFSLSEKSAAALTDPVARIQLGAHLAVCLSVSLICGALRSSEIEAATIAKEERAGRSRLDALLNSITDKFLTISPELKLIGFNEAAAERWNLDESLLGEGLDRVLPVSIANAISAPIRRTLDLQTSVSIEVTDVNADRYYEARIFPSPEGVLVYFHNMTDRVKANAAISELALEQRRVNALLDSLLTHAPLGFAFFGQDHQFERVNEHLAEMFEVPLDQFEGRTIDQIAPGISDQIGEMVDRVFKGNRAIEQVEISNKGASNGNHVRTWHCGFYPVSDSDGMVRSVGAILIDITQRIEVEELLRRSERQFRDLADNSPMMIWVCNPDVTAAWFNKPWLEFRNLSLDGAICEGCFGHVHPEDQPWVEETYREALEKGEPFSIEYRSLNGHGEYRWIHMKSNPIFGLDGKVINFLMSSIDVTDRITMEENLRVSLAGEREARSEAEETNRLRDEFLASLSHELRTPLTTMLGWTELMMRPSISPADMADGLQAIQKSSKLQLQLINDLLDMNRISVGKMQLEFDYIELFDIVQSTVEMFQSAAKEKNIDLSLKQVPKPLIVRADPDRFIQVLSNLISNAIKFTPSGGRVEVSILDREGKAILEVSDTGIGIESEFLPHVFDRFRQADASKSRRHGGLGLGLAIAKQLVELHGGSIEAESDGQGKGTTFRITVDTVDGGTRPEQLRPRPQATLDEDHRRLVEVCVLLVEDDAASRELLKKLLEVEGAVVIAAGSAPVARRLLKEISPDILVSDIGLPDEDGFQLIRSIRSATDHSTIPAVALTAFAGGDDRTRAFEAGFNMYLTKPVEPEELVRAILEMRTRQY